MTQVEPMLGRRLARLCRPAVMAVFAARGDDDAVSRREVEVEVGLEDVEDTAEVEVGPEDVRDEDFSGAGSAWLLERGAIVEDGAISDDDPGLVLPVDDPCAPARATQRVSVPLAGVNALRFKVSWKRQRGTAQRRSRSRKACGTWPEGFGGGRRGPERSDHVACVSIPHVVRETHSDVRWKRQVATA